MLVVGEGLADSIVVLSSYTHSQQHIDLSLKTFCALHPHKKDAVIAISISDKAINTAPSDEHGECMAFRRIVLRKWGGFVEKRGEKDIVSPPP